MRKTKECPKCQSTDIVKFKGYDSVNGDGNFMMTGMFSGVNVHRYICCNCGFTEEWIDKKDLEKVYNSNKAIHPKND